jgi:multidrug efflux pump subunit AcrB
MRITDFSVRNYQFTSILFVMVTLLGLTALFTMPRGEDPPFGAPIFIIIGVYPGASPDDIESLVADPIEKELYKLGDVKKMLTSCNDGVMAIQLEFNYGVNVDNKNNDVIREVNKVRPDLPDGLIDLWVQRAASSDVAILQTALVSETASDSLMQITAERLQKRIEKLSDIKDVDVQATREAEIRIELDLQRMAQYKLGLNQVLQLLQAANLNIPGGDVDLGSSNFNVKTNSDFSTIDDVANTIVRTTTEGRVVHLRDIANVYKTSEEAVHLARQDTKPAVWVVTKLKDRRNIIQAREKVQSVLDTFSNTLPKELVMVQAFDQAVGVERRLGGLGKDFLIAIALVMLTLLPLGFRASLVVMISIPLSLSIGLTLLNLAGFTLNQLSFVGLVIALGLLVDDSIVIVENIERFLRLGYSKKQAATEAVKQIGSAVVGTTVVLILAFLPLCFLPEGSGEFIRSLPMAVILTVLASLLVALTIIPFLSSVMLKAHEGEHTEGNLFMRGFKRYINTPYQKWLLWSFRHPVITLVGAGLIFLGSLILAGQLGFSLFPMADKPMFNVEIELPSGANIAATDQVTRKVERLLLAQPLVKSISSNVGRGNPRVYYNEFQRQQSANFAHVVVQTDTHITESEMVALTDSLRIKLVQVPGAQFMVERFAQGPPVVAPIEFRIIGENTDTLRSLAERVEAVIKSTEGTRDVGNESRINKTDLEVKIDKEKAGLMGIPTAEIARTVRLAVAGLDLGDFRDENGNASTLRITTRTPSTDALATLNQVYITSLSGSLVPLSQVAEVKLAASPSLIRHFNKDRYAIVTAFPATGFNIAALTDEIEKKLSSIEKPDGYTFLAAGERETSQESFGGMGTIILISIFGLLAVLILEFRTFKSTLIVLSVVPMGIIGAIVTLWLVGETLSFVATIGMIALIGIEIKNSILLVDYTNQLREQGMSVREAILDGAETRFLPILLTSLTAIGGMIPLVLERSPLISPLAWVLIGGIISSTLLSRIVTPVMYLLLPPKVENIATK